VAIPIISEIIGFIQGFFQVLPKSLRYIFFLFILIGFAAFIPLFLHIIGIHCDGTKNVMRTSEFDFGNNLKIAFAGDELYNSSNYVPEYTVGFLNLPESCVRKLINLNGTTDYKLCSSGQSGCFYALRATRAFVWSSSPKCVKCVNFSYLTIVDIVNLVPTSDSTYYCIGDAYTLNKTSCTDTCDIPIGYMFDGTTGTFKCIETSICGGNNATVTYSVDALLEQANAKRLYSSVANDKDYKSAIKIKCDGNLTPQLTVFGIPIFDYKLWLALIVLGALFFFLNKIKRH